MTQKHVDMVKQALNEAGLFSEENMKPTTAVKRALEKSENTPAHKKTKKANAKPEKPKKVSEKKKKKEPKKAREQPQKIQPRSVQKILPKPPAPVPKQHWVLQTECPNGDPGCEVLHYELVSMDSASKSTESAEFPDAFLMDQGTADQAEGLATDASTEAPVLKGQPENEPVEGQLLTAGAFVVQETEAKRASELKERGRRALLHFIWSVLLEAVRESLVLYVKKECGGCRTGTWLYHDQCDAYTTGVWFDNADEIMRKVNVSALDKHWADVLNKHFHPLTSYQVTEMFEVPSLRSVVEYWNAPYHTDRTNGKYRNFFKTLRKDLNSRFYAQNKFRQVSELFFDDELKACITYEIKKEAQKH